MPQMYRGMDKNFNKWVSRRQNAKKAPRRDAFFCKESLVSARNLLQHFQSDFAFGDFAQRGNAGFVFAFNLGGMSLAEHAGAVSCSQNQLETVGDFFEAIFDGDAGHGDSFGVIGSIKGCEAP